MSSAWEKMGFADSPDYFAALYCPHAWMFVTVFCKVCLPDGLNTPPGSAGREIGFKRPRKEQKTRADIIRMARRYFRTRCCRSTLEKTAKAAGSDPGAVYWHFSDKAELFFAMREDVFSPLVERTDAPVAAGSVCQSTDAIKRRSASFPRSKTVRSCA